MNSDKKQTFISEVKEQIKSKEAKKFVADELNYHMTQAKLNWVEKGVSEEEAEDKAIQQMGSPVKLGIQMNKLHRPRVDWWLLALLVPVLLMGFLPLIPPGYSGVQHFIVTKVAIVILGAVTTIVIMLVDYQKWQAKGWIFYIIGLLPLLLIVFIPNRMINGTQSLEIGDLTIESSMALPFLFLAWASFFQNSKLRVWQFILLVLVPFIMFLSVPSVPTAYLYLVMVFAMLWRSKFSRRTITIIFTSAAASFMFLMVYLFNSHIELRDRLLGFINPEKYQNTSGYMVIKLKEFMSTAGWFGHSKGYEFIPGAHTDFAYVTLTYYYGWLLSIILILLLTMFVVRTIIVAFQIKDSYGKILLVGATALYTTQLVTNIAMIFGIFPMVAMPLPFISYGLMPTLLNAALIGIILSVFRRKDLVRVT